MTIPFLSYFKKDKGGAAIKEKAAAPARPVIPPLEKPSSERFSKTVMPNATRTLPPQDPFEMAARSTALGGAIAVAPTSQRTVSFSPLSPVMAAKRDLPPAVALPPRPPAGRPSPPRPGRGAPTNPPPYYYNKLQRACGPSCLF